MESARMWEVTGKTVVGAAEGTQAWAGATAMYEDGSNQKYIREKEQVKVK